MHECRGSYWTDGKSIVGTPVRRPLHKAELPVSGNALSQRRTVVVGTEIHRGSAR